MFEQVTMLVLVAILSESLTEVVKNALPKVVKNKITYVASIIIGVALAYAFDLNFLALEGVYAKHVSIVAAGLIASRGANYVHGLMKELGAIQPVERKIKPKK